MREFLGGKYVRFQAFSKIQDYFCMVNGIYLSCLTKKDGVMTEVCQCNDEWKSMLTFIGERNLLPDGIITTGEARFNMGIYYIQGYFFDKPMCIESFEEKYI